MNRGRLRTLMNVTTRIQEYVEVAEDLFSAFGGCEDLWRQEKVCNQIQLLKKAASGLMSLLVGEPEE